MSHRAPKASARSASPAPKSGRGQLRQTAEGSSDTRRRAQNTANAGGDKAMDVQKENYAFTRHGSEEHSLTKQASGVDHKLSGIPQSYDAADDIQDIDRRLNALQQFLTAAKAPR